MKKAKKASRTWINCRRTRNAIFKSNEYVVLKDKKTGLHHLYVSNKMNRHTKAHDAPKNIKPANEYHWERYNQSTQFPLNIPSIKKEEEK